jgi:UDP-N-acetyl-D-glucosamine dehydrogenase
MSMRSQPVDGRNVVVVGQGYVGLALAMRAIDVGHSVVGFDTDEERVQRLGAGEPQVEDVPREQLAAAVGSGRYRATSRAEDLSNFDVAVIAVPTPLTDGAPDLSHVERAAQTLGTYVRSGSTVVLESTTYPGTTEELLVPLLEQASGLRAGYDFHVGYSPERIDPGNPKWTLVNTPKVISGIDEASLNAVRSFYDTIVEQTVAVSRPKEAELTKLLENTFRHVNIALVNELAMFAHDLDIDMRESIRAASTKPFGFMPFQPGPGVGGHCLPIDPSYLSWQVQRRLGEPFRFVELANAVNAHMPHYVIRRLMVGLNERKRAINGSRILLLGLSYKANAGDSRESPALVIAEELLSLGAEVRVIDPYVDARWVPAPLIRVELDSAELQAADAVVLLTDHDAFDLESVVTHAKYVLDTRSRMSAPNVEQL